MNDLRSAVKMAKLNTMKRRARPSAVQVDPFQAHCVRNMERQEELCALDMNNRGDHMAAMEHLAAQQLKAMRDLVDATRTVANKGN